MKTNPKSLRTLVCCLGWFVLLTAPVKSVGDEPKALGVTITWDPNTEPELAGYRIYVGRQTRAYDDVIDVGLQTSGRVPALEAGITFYFAVTAYSSGGLESPFSEEVSYTVPIDGTNAMAVPLTVTIANAQSPVAIQFLGQAGLTFFVQASDDLAGWQTLQTFPSMTNGVVRWNDAAPSSRQKRFYRVIAQTSAGEALSLLKETLGNVGVALPPWP